MIMRNAFALVALCSFLGGCAVDAPLESETRALSTPDAGDCPVICGPAEGLGPDGCCTAVDSTPLKTLSLNALAGSGPGWGADTDGCMQFNWAGAGGHLLVPLPLPEGAVVAAIKVHLIGDGAADVETTLFALDAAMNRTAIGFAHFANPPPVWTAYTMPVGSSVSLAAEGSMFLDIDANAVNPRAGTVTVQYH
jgi:hypothetical protein